jgi:MFS family permease
MASKWPHLILLSLASLLAMSLWFSATAVVPALMDHWEVSGGQAAWLTMSVQLGFVLGALLSALLNIPDLWSPHKVFAAGALLGALLNALIPALDTGFMVAILLRFGTGMALAAVYPVGMKIMATWTKQDRGLAIGMLVGALTVGSASPHMVKALGGIGAWQPVIYAVSCLAVAGGVIGWFAGRLGPMWTWIPLFLVASFSASSLGNSLDQDTVTKWASVAAFGAIAAGGAGSLLAGHIADRWGRCRTTIVSLWVSGVCALSIGFCFGRSPLIITIIALIWGFAVVADSAQFSSSVSELSDREYMGTQLTTQTAMGFLLTLISIRLIPGALDMAGWRWAFAILAPGPAFGIWAMWRLKHSPDAARLAGGRG